MEPLYAPRPIPLPTNGCEAPGCEAPVGMQARLWWLANSEVNLYGEQESTTYHSSGATDEVYLLGALAEPKLLYMQHLQHEQRWRCLS